MTSFNFTLLRLFINSFAQITLITTVTFLYNNYQVNVHIIEDNKMVVKYGLNQYAHLFTLLLFREETIINITLDNG